MMTSLQRVLTTLGFNEPDKVPNFLLFSMYGAKELGISIKDYFADAHKVVEAQLRMRAKYQTDCLYAFYYASAEIEAFGGETLFIDNGPPNAGPPIIKDANDINTLQVPVIEEQPVLVRILESIGLLKHEVQDQAPIIGVVMSPFSIPIMQMGSARYIELMYRERELFWKLMEVNRQFCTNWANAQLAAGATAICYFDPFSSPTMVSPKLYKETGFEIAKSTIGQIQGPTATHFASGRCLPVVDLVAQTGTAIIGTGDLDRIAAIKQQCTKKLSILGNLNGLEMISWTPEKAAQKTKELIRQAAPGGGFLLSDGHGEMPWQVSEKVLLSIAEAIEQYGNYPINTQ